jgi:hypothetical protein
MARRHDDALFAQTGACNATAVSKALARAYEEAMDEMRTGPLEQRSTTTVNRDPACQLILHQLCFLAGIPTIDGCGADGWYDQAVAECQRLASPETQVLYTHSMHQPPAVAETAP